MKHFFIFIAFVLFLFVVIVTQSTAQTTTPSSKKATVTDSETNEKLSEQINNLKDRIASRVAELQLVEKKGVVGTVNEATSSQMTLNDVDGEVIIVDVDEITKFSSPNNKNDFGISDIDEGMKISVVGNYNKQSRRLLARFVDEVTIPAYINGMVAEVDEDSGTITVATEDKKQIVVDVETVTKTSEYDGEETVRSGFSQIEVGTRVVLQGYADKSDANRVVATRILLLPGFPKNPKIVIPDEALLNDESVPSTGSGKKLTPIR